MLRCPLTTTPVIRSTGIAAHNPRFARVESETLVLRNVFDGSQDVLILRAKASSPENARSSA